MLITAKPLTLATLAAALATPAQALAIDDFADPYNTNYVGYASGPSGFSIPSSVAPAAVPGSYRSVAMAGDPAATVTTFAAIGGGGELWGFSSGAQRLNFSINYGTLAAMNLSLSGSAVLRLDMYLNTPMKLVVYASTETTTGANPDGSAFSADLPTLFRQSLDIPLSAFTTNSSTGRAVDWADVDSLALYLSADGPVAASGDAFWALSLTAVPVPEPASAVLVAAGLALLLSRRKHIFARAQHT